MAIRLWKVEVVNVDVSKNELMVRRKKTEEGKVVDISTPFFVFPKAQINDKSGNKLKLSDIKPGNKITIDYLKESDGKLAALGIKVSS